MKAALYFADDQIKHDFFMLQSGRAEEKEIFNQLNTAFDMIVTDPFCGIQVPKRLIPKMYITKYGIDKNAAEIYVESRGAMVIFDD